MASILVVDRDPIYLENMRTTLITLGYGSINAVSDHDAALKVIEQRNFSHVFFTAVETNMPPAEFLRKALQLDPKMITIPSSAQPDVDDVFELLRIGARGFLVKPFSGESVEATIVEATKGEGFSRAILDARDRNEAFSALLAANLDKLADAMRISKNLSLSTSRLTSHMADFASAAKLARNFAKNGEEGLRSRMVDFFVSLSSGPATRLGRLRRKLAEKRISGQDTKTDQKSPREGSEVSNRSD